MSTTGYEERPYLQIDLYELQSEWELYNEKKKKLEGEDKEETVIVIDI